MFQSNSRIDGLQRGKRVKTGELVGVFPVGAGEEGEKVFSLFGMDDFGVGDIRRVGEHGVEGVCKIVGERFGGFGAASRRCRTDTAGSFFFVVGLGGFLPGQADGGNCAGVDGQLRFFGIRGSFEGFRLENGIERGDVGAVRPREEHVFFMALQRLLFGRFVLSAGD